MTSRKTIALIDDDKNAANTLSVLLEDAGFEPLVLREPLGSLSEATAFIKTRTQAALCDHRLRHFSLIPFTGAELVAQLYLEGFPAVLITQYLGIDVNVELRKYRQNIPILLARTDADPDTLASSFEVCQAELSGNRPPHRRPWRSLVHVQAKDSEAGEDVLDAVIPSWRPYEAVRFPASLLGPLMNQIPEGLGGALDIRFFAQVNIGAESAQEIFLSNFELATEPTDEDKIA